MNSTKLCRFLLELGTPTPTKKTKRCFNHPCIHEVRVKLVALLKALSCRASFWRNYSQSGTYWTSSTSISVRTKWTRNDKSDNHHNIIDVTYTIEKKENHQNTCTFPYISLLHHLIIQKKEILQIIPIPRPATSWWRRPLLRCRNLRYQGNHGSRQETTLCLMMEMNIDWDVPHFRWLFPVSPNRIMYAYTSIISHFE